MYNNLLRFSFIFAMTTMAICLKGQELLLSANDAVVKPGGTGVVTIKGENPSFITAWQMFVQLPEGVEIYSDDIKLNDRYPWEPNRHTYAHRVDVNEMEDNTYLLTCYADQPSIIYGETGVLVSLTLRCQDNFKGRHEARISDIAVADFTETPRQTNQSKDLVIHITDEGTAAIEGVEMTQDRNRTVTVNLNGQKVAGKPQRKGVYIINGKKQIVK